MKRGRHSNIVTLTHTHTIINNNHNYKRITYNFIYDHKHTIKHVINNNVSNQLTNSNREQHTSRLATLLFLCSMMVDEQITLVPLLSDCRPDNQNWSILNS